MRRSIIVCAIVLGFVSPSLFAGDVRVTVRKSGGGQVQIAKDASGTTADTRATDAKNAFEKKKQELKDIVDRIAKLRGHAASIDWGDGTPKVTMTIDWGDGSPASNLRVTNVVARVRWCEDVALNAGVPGVEKHARKYLDQTTPNVAAQVGSDPGAEKHVGKVIDATSPSVTAQVGPEPGAEQGGIRRPQQPSPDEIQKANKLVAEYNSKRDAYTLEKPSGNYFALLPRLEVDPIELKTNSAAAAGEAVGSGKYVVLVYKSEGGQWVKQPDRTLNTDDAKAATDYVDQVNAVQGWMATTNVPEDKHRKLPGKMKSGQLSLKTKNRS
jgi:hypothetical protein